MSDKIDRFANRIASQAPLAERMAAQNRSVNVPMECSKCGSTYFMDVHFAQYADGGYGSVQFRLLTVTPIQAKQCACGNLLWPRPTGAKIAPGADPEFHRSMKAGVAYRQLQETRASEVVSLREYQALQRQVSELEQRLEALAVPQRQTIVPKALVEVETNAEPEQSETISAPPVERPTARTRRGR